MPESPAPSPPPAPEQHQQHHHLQYLNNISKNIISALPLAPEQH